MADLQEILSLANQPQNIYEIFGKRLNLSTAILPALQMNN